MVTQRKLFRKLFRSKKAVSQTLSAMMMIFLFTAAIATVWAWLFPTYRRFQTTNTINSMSSVMLSIDESIYDIYGSGIGTTDAIRVNPDVGYFFYEVGKDVSLQFSDLGGTYNETLQMQELGKFCYQLDGRQGVILPTGDSKYLKGPDDQYVFFVNGSDDGINYQGLTNIILMRPEDKTMKHALVDDQLTPATPDAPVMATCPGCGGQVKLRQRQGTYFWRHVELPREGCRPTDPEPAVQKRTQ